MQPKPSYTLWWLGLIVLLFVSWLVYPVWRFQHDYGQAEPLQLIIWPMAGDMKLFAEEHGRPPASLDEIAAYAPKHNVSSLRAYEHEFTPTGPRRFFLRVNRRYQFAIDEEYAPSWVTFPAPSKKPAQPQ